MARTVGIGIQDFDKLITNNCFYVDKTSFIKEWWESRDEVTLIARPRRFGKTLTMSMVERFFSVKYAGKGEVFERLSIWKEQGYRDLQGKYPVISLSFAPVKENNIRMAINKINDLLAELYAQNAFLKRSGLLEDSEIKYYDRIQDNVCDVDTSLALSRLSDYLSRYYGKKAIILLDEYDTPLQEAYVGGYWEELVAFTRNLFNATFKTNTYLERGIMTGITRVGKESIFSDLNNLKVITATSDEYADIFGFTEEEVFAALDEFGLEGKGEVKAWYNGFIFGNKTDIYNPWSILNYLDTGKKGTYWANTSSNSLVGKLIRTGSGSVKQDFAALLKGESIHAVIDEQIVYDQLDDNEDAIWSLLLAGGYLKVLSIDERGMQDGLGGSRYELALTNKEVRITFASMVRGWFAGRARGDYNMFVKAMLLGDVDAMNEYMNNVALNTFSSFDTGNKPSESLPERFYHGFVLGLLVELSDRYILNSNRESGFGRYDVILEPKNSEDDAVIMEFKVFNARKEKSLVETLANALKQIEDRKYEASLIERGISKERIHKYGFAFQGKKVLIGAVDCLANII